MNKAVGSRKFLVASDMFKIYLNYKRYLSNFVIRKLSLSKKEFKICFHLSTNI